MALLSEIDWLILLGAGAFLLLGKENGAFLRQLGRYYGRLVRLKQELLADFSRAADLPPPTLGRPMTLRTAFMQFADPAPGRASGIPAAVTTPPVPVIAAASATSAPGSGFGPGVWSPALPSLSPEDWTR